MKVATPTLATLATIVCIGLYGCGNSSDVTNAAVTLDSTPPPAPENLSLVTVSEFNELTWAPSAAADVAKYQVFRYQPDPSRDNAYVIIGETTTASLSLGRTAVETDTYFRVRAVDESGNRSAYSLETHVVVPAIGNGGDSDSGNGGGGTGGGGSGGSGGTGGDDIGDPRVR